MQADNVEVVEVTKGFLSLVAKENILAGSFLADVWGPVVSQATPYTIQVDVNKHVDPVGPLKRTNHSCNPNAKFVVLLASSNTTFTLQTLRTIIS